MQSMSRAQLTKQFSAHTRIPMMSPVQNVQLDQRFRYPARQPLASRINERAEIGMVNETFATGLQFLCNLTQIHVDDLAIHVDKGIEAENKVDGRIRQHRQRTAVVKFAMNAPVGGKSLATRLDAFGDAINGPEILAVI